MMVTLEIKKERRQMKPKSKENEINEFFHVSIQ